MRCLVGIGQPLRGDDSVGHLFVDSFPSREGLKKCLVGDDVTRVFQALERCRLLIMVDAVQSGAPAGTLHRFDLLQPPASRPWRFSTHTLDPLEVVELARRLGRKLPERMILFGVEGCRFELGEALSEAVSASLQELGRRVEEELGHVSGHSR